MTQDVVFEKKVGDDWQRVRSTELQKGDVTRMKDPQGSVMKALDGCAEYRVSTRGGVDPDSHKPFDLSLEPI